MKSIKRFISVTLAAGLLFNIAIPMANAALPQVATDEAVYVNLDYYGAPTDTSIVKGCDLNGNLEFDDYGAYSKVTNMTDYSAPEITADGVHWKLDDYVGRFYYECTPADGNLNLPWNFDVSYKLNGVPKRAEELAGVAGLVEINVEAIPNENAAAYYKNNMILQVASMVNMQDVLSVEAPGAQLQSIGTYKAIIFAALPGEHTTFTLRIGSDSFESTGMIMMMVPGTLEQMKQIKDIKEAKDTVGDSADAVYGSLNDILGILNGMTGSVKSTQSGLAGLNGTRGFVSSAKNGIYDNAATALSDLTSLSYQLVGLLPHLTNGQQFVRDINGDVNDIVSTVSSSKTEINGFTDNLTNIQADVTALRQMLGDFNATASDRKKVTDSLAGDIATMKEDASSLRGNLEHMRNTIEELRNSVKKLRGVMDKIPKIQKPNMPSIPGGGDADGIIAAITAALKGIQMSVNSTIDSLNAMINELNLLFDRLNTTLSDLSSFLARTGEALDTLANMCDGAEGLADSLQSTLDLATTYFDLLDNNYQNTDDLMGQMNGAGELAKQALEKTNRLVDQANAANDTLNQYETGIENTLKDTGSTISSLSAALDSTNNFLQALKDIMQQSGSQLDSGTQDTLNGLIDVLDRGLEGLSMTGTVQNANTTIKNAVDGQVDKYTEDNNLLNLDAEQNMVSFTSDRNPEPQSIQVLLRTEEISIDDDEDNLADLEGGGDQTGFFGRVANIFKKIWSTVTGVFQKD